MSGILDSKSRIIDAMLTSEGRRQMAEGTFEVTYVTFSDAGVSYIPDSSGHEDPTSKIYFEACNLPQDQITFEANDEGNLIAFRSQDIKLKTPSGNVPAGYAEGTLVNGRLAVYQFHHGRRVKTSFIQEDSTDLNKGFIYSDKTGLTASILAKPALKAGSIQAPTPPPGEPYVAYFGTKGGMGPQQFAQTLSGAISQLRDAGGPNVFCSAVNDSVYLDSNDDFIGTKIFSSGTLSAPFLIEEGAIGGRLMVDELENANFSSQIQGILTSSFDNFLELQTLSTIDRLFQDDQFQLSKNDVVFDMTKLSKTQTQILSTAPTLNSIDSIFNDNKMSHLENFMYLPPIVKTSDTVVPDKTKLENIYPYLLGNYPSWGDNEGKMPFSKLMEELKPYENLKETIDFDQTSLKNRVIAQFFEVKDSFVSKLDVVNFGDVMNDLQESSVVTNKVFFVGKTFIDNRGTTCFVNMFTLIFSRNQFRESETIS